MPQSYRASTNGKERFEGRHYRPVANAAGRLRACLDGRTKPRFADQGPAGIRRSPGQPASGNRLGRPAKITAERKKKVERILGKTGNMSAAAKAIGVSRQALYQWCDVERRQTRRGLKYIVKWKKD